MKNLILKNNNTAVTTSQIVAEMFDKDHKNVLRDIEALDCSPEFTRLNF
jgi:Rha family phage regulatory protein